MTKNRASSALIGTPPPSGNEGGLPWTAEHEQLEASACWSELLSIAELAAPQEMCPRWQACLARILAFLGERSRSLELIRLARAKCPEAQDDARIATLLAEATLHRSANQWCDAEKSATLALRLSQHSPNPSLFADALFAVGLALAEQGRIYRALDHFQQIAHLRNVSSYRRGIAAMNEAWTLWDIGQPQAMRQVLSRTPGPFQDRIRLGLAILDEDDELPLQILLQGPSNSAPQLIRPVTEADSIVQFLCEWWAVRGRLRLSEVPERSWALSHLHERLQQALDPQTHALLEGFDRVFRAQAWQTPPLNLTWRNEIDLIFLEILSLAPKDPAAASESYRKRLLPQLETHRLSLPTLPSWPDIEHPSSAWNRALASLLGLKLSSSQPRDARALKLQGRHVVHAGQKVDLGKSPVSRRLLTILSGKQGRTLRKEEIHHQLTSAKYNPLIHDDRLHKLLRRLNRKLETVFGFECWNMPGDNTVVLSVDLEIEF